jgi:hypothetical protein
MAYLIKDLCSYLMHFKRYIAVLLFIGLALTSTLYAATKTHSVRAETGKGTDIFKVITTIFGVDDTIGDMVAVVTVNDEAAKVKLFDASGPEVVPLNASEGGGHLIEYVATFPNVTVNSGDPYKACIFTVKDFELICKSGHNSPAARPEFVDLSLNTTRGDVEQVDEGEGNSDEDNGSDGIDGTEDEDDLPQGISPTV